MSECPTAFLSENMKRKIIIFITFITFIFFIILQLYLSNRLSSEGKKLEAVQNKIIIAKEENKSLKKEIAVSGCLSVLIEEAEKKGFIANPPINNLTGKVPIAVKAD